MWLNLAWGCAGGLLNEPRGDKPLGGIVMASPATYGLPPKQSPGSILRSRVSTTSHTVRL